MKGTNTMKTIIEDASARHLHRRREREETRAHAETIWLELDDNAKRGIRFGLFPHDAIKAAEILGYDGKEICIALMNCADKDGGMRA